MFYYKRSTSKNLKGKQPSWFEHLFCRVKLSSNLELEYLEIFHIIVKSSPCGYRLRVVNLKSLQTDLCRISRYQENLLYSLVQMILNFIIMIFLRRQFT